MAKFDKYAFYEQSVQSPLEDGDLFANMYKQARGREALKLREDFCGTFQFASQWVQRSPKHTAEALDLDPEPLAYGKRNHLKKLTASQKQRLSVQRRNVISVSRAKADLIVANNFSFYVFRERQQLVDYFSACRKSLGPRGMAIVEMVGGPGFVERNKEQRTIKEMGRPRFKYIWDQRSFNPITREGNYSIHFKLPNGRQHKHAFTYHWRIWTIPEVREAMRDAGFSKTTVFWETSYRGEATGEYLMTEKGHNDWTWLAYVGALK